MKNSTKLLGSIAAVILLTVTVEAASFREDRFDRRADSGRRSEHQLSRVRAVMLPLLRVTNYRVDPAPFRFLSSTIGQSTLLAQGRGVTT